MQLIINVEIPRMPLGKIKKTEFKNSEKPSLNKVETYRCLLLRMQHAHCLSRVSEDSPCCSANIEWRDRLEDCTMIRGEID